MMVRAERYACCGRRELGIFSQFNAEVKAIDAQWIRG
jgi:hypothetical protein